MDEKINYIGFRRIHQNPVEEGYALRAEDYVYNNAIYYAGEKDYCIA